MKSQLLIVLLILFLTLVLLCSCRKDTLYLRLDNYLGGIELGDSVKINMADVFTGNWDTMYVLMPNPGKVDYKYQKDQDIERRIVITNGGRIVHSECEIAIETPYKVTFETGVRRYFLREDAVFCVKREHDDKIGRWYCLTPLGPSQATQIAVAEKPQDSVICGKTYKNIIKLYSDNILAFEKYSEKYRVWQTPVFIAKDGPTVYLEETEDRDMYYFGDFAPSRSRKFIYMSKYYTTLELSESNNEILKFHSGIIIDSQTGKELLSLFGADAAGEWNCDDEWVSGD